MTVLLSHYVTFSVLEVVFTAAVSHRFRSH